MTRTVPARRRTTLAAAVAANPGGAAAVFADRGLRWTWGQFAAAVDRLATGLLDLGVDGVMTDRADVLAEVYARRGFWPQR